MRELIRKIPSLEDFFQDISRIEKETTSFMEKFTNKDQLKDQNVFSESFWQLPPRLNQFYLSFYEQDEKDTLTWESTLSFLSDGIFSIAQSEIHRRYLFMNLLYSTSSLKLLPEEIEFIKQPIEEIKIDGLMGGVWEIDIDGQKIHSKELILNDHFFWKQLQAVKKSEFNHFISSSWDRLVTDEPLSLPQNSKDEQALYFWKKRAFKELLNLRPELKLATIQGIQKAYFAYPRAFYPFL